MNLRVQVSQKRRLRMIGQSVSVTALIVILAVSGLMLVDKHLSAVYAVSTKPLPIEITVNQGDTLWIIAKQYFPETDPRETVWEIRQLNPSLDPGKLQIGQTIWIPGVE